MNYPMSYRTITNKGQVYYKGLILCSGTGKEQRKELRNS